MIVFEIPQAMVQHPDAFVEYTGPEWLGAGKPQSMYIRGCRTCQKNLSRCKCGERRVESKVLVHEGRGGKLGSPNFHRFFRIETDTRGSRVVARSNQELDDREGVSE